MRNQQKGKLHEMKAMISTYTSINEQEGGKLNIICFFTIKYNLYNEKNNHSRERLASFPLDYLLR